MLVMFPALAVFLTRIMCIWGPLAPTRERLVRQMEDWAYSKKVVTVEIIANIVTVLLSVVLLVCTAAENPNVPVRVWFSVHAVQCLVHVILVWSQYRRVDRRRRRRRELHLERADAAAARFRYNLDFFNMLVSFVWVNFGVDWVKSEHKLLRQNAPWLYWWFRAYLAFDAAFATIWLAGIIACCCLLFVILIPRQRVRTVAEQEGALEGLNVLPKYRFHMSRNLESRVLVME
ncbi:E3 ubiquitin protein ligase RIE1-like isoform X2 [Silene latifolia]|uniref:E3 ubiquitin protein ligase RIE1-like isoform X2 n=1 Tax=Silene latifolia TaxID=37657 RepID=UPI003D77490E